MESTRQRGQVYRFGAFEVDLEAGKLLKSGVQLRLQEQPFRVLVLLLEKPGRVVTREDLRRQVWPDTHVDFDHSLNTAINKIRGSLGDIAANPRFVETLPGRGYRFLMPVQRDMGRSDSSAPIGAADVERPQGLTLLRQPYATLGAAALAFAVIFGGFNLLRTMQTVIHEKPPVVTPLTAFPGFETSPTFSPDGSQVAFTWKPETQDNFDIYVMVVGQSEPLRLTDNPANDYSPAWSPDGQWIAFLRDLGTEGRAEVLVVPPLGGADLKLGEVTAPGRPTTTRGVSGRALSWHPDAAGVVVADRESLNDPLRLFLVSTEDGRRLALTSPPREGFGDLFGAFSANGGRLAATRGILNPFQNQVLIQRFSAALEPVGDPSVVMHGAPTAPRVCVWTEAEHDLICSSFFPGSLWRVAADGPRAPRRLPFVGNRATDPTVSFPGRRLAFAEWSIEQNIWRLDLPFPGAPATAATPLISSTSINTYPRYSPDGRRIAFSSTRLRSEGIWICEPDGSNLVKLTSFSAGIPNWSPDGRHLVMDRADGDIWVLDARGEAAPRRITTHSARDIVPTWSRDGRWIYFSSKRSGENQIWKVPAEGGTPSQITQLGGVYGEESANGQLLYYSKEIGLPNSLWRVPVDGGEEAQVLESLSSYANFTVFQDGIYFIPAPELGANPQIQFLSFATEETTTVRKLDRPVHTGLSVTPDGLSVLYTQIDREASDLMLVENFR